MNKNREFLDFWKAMYFAYGRRMPKYKDWTQKQLKDYNTIYHNTPDRYTYTWTYMGRNGYIVEEKLTGIFTDKFIDWLENDFPTTD